jgi:nitrate/nitrite transporter NarK
MRWFAPRERGLALGIRQTAIPLGGLIVAVVLPGLAESGGSDAAFLFLAGLAALGAIVGLVFIRGRDGTDELEPESVAATLRDARLGRLSVSSGLYLDAQVASSGSAYVPP